MHLTVLTVADGNTERLARTVRSVIKQDAVRTQHLILAPVGAPDIARGADTRLRHISETGSVAAALNEAAALADGSHLLVLAPGEVLTKQAGALFAAAAHDHPKAAAHCAGGFVTDGEGHIQRPERAGAITKADLFWRGRSVFRPGIAFARAEFLRLGGFDPVFGALWFEDFLLRLTGAGGQAVRARGFAACRRAPSAEERCAARLEARALARRHLKRPLAQLGSGGWAWRDVRRFLSAPVEAAEATLWLWRYRRAAAAH